MANRPHTLNETHAHLLYKGLTPKQKMFVDAYIETGDRTEAAKKAYGETDNLQSLGWRCLNTPAIRKVLTYYSGQEMGGGAMNRSELLMLISSRLRDTNTSGGDFRKLAELLVSMKFQGGMKATVEDDGDGDVDELVRKLEGKG